MFRRMLALLDPPERPSGRDDADDLQHAAAVLLMVSARLDGTLAPAERQTIRTLLAERLGVADADALVAEAEEESRTTTDLYGITRIIKDRLDESQRIAVLEMLWEVAYADGRADDYEANLARRVAGLLYVSDQDAGEARKRVLERRQTTPPTSD